MILLLISLVVLFSAIVIYRAYKPKHKQYVRRISIRHVKFTKLQLQNEDIQDEDLEDELDFLLFED